MSTVSSMVRRQHGFTIVELLIVIVVIAILAAITVVAYNGIQARARDNIRMADLSSLVKAIRLYAVDNGNNLNASSDCGNNNDDGNLEFDYDGSGPRRPIMDCLLSPGYLSRVVRDPSGISPSCSGLTCFKYMKYSCGLGTSYTLTWKQFLSPPLILTVLARAASTLPMA